MTMYTIAPLLIASAIVINLIVWWNEFQSDKILTLVCDLGGTLLLVTMSGGGMIITASTLYASLLWSWYMNKRAHIPDLHQIKNKKKRIVVKILMIVTALILLKGITGGIL